MYKIQVIEDDRSISDSVVELIKSWGMEARGTADFSRVIDEFKEYKPQLVLLDISLPFCNGFHRCEEIRKISKVPIIFISSASDNMSMIMAMNMGADDFISKPFDGSVLIAKIQALLRRTYSFAEDNSVIEHNGAMLNTEDASLTYGSEKLTLSKNEYRILFTLMRSHGKVVSREKLMEALWQTDEFVDENTLTVNVNRIRKKLASIGLDDFIETRFGVGYIIG